MRHGAITRKSQDAELQYQLESANVSHKNIIRSTYDPTRGCSIELIVRRTPPGAGRETTARVPRRGHTARFYHMNAHRCFIFRKGKTRSGRAPGMCAGTVQARPHLLRTSFVSSGSGGRARDVRDRASQPRTRTPQHALGPTTRRRRRRRRRRHCHRMLPCQAARRCLQVLPMMQAFALLCSWRR